ncbi:hypothetical protein [Hoyosella subflava]|uniref:Uncharacterized protein n=1 Tax=Hoyosella subflava (strain DSM 45089 / JCM 17490 / NBRC 109087 / DQS3-9A1) TaxID=443218 RepID=F6ERG4_HOYSD|nr:hypothetical protein [Hoyosella subflava]AEF38484.1 hypothetical protein AS9A_0024 [Hoyosella subflava DQS3-9A1]
MRGKHGKKSKSLGGTLGKSIAAAAVLAGVAGGVKMFMRRGEGIDEPAPAPPTLQDYDNPIR